LKDVFVRNGRAYLKPECISIKEGSRSDLDDLRDKIFVEALMRRLGYHIFPILFFYGPLTPLFRQDSTSYPSAATERVTEHKPPENATNGNTPRSNIAEPTSRIRMSPGKVSPFFSDSHDSGRDASGKAPNRYQAHSSHSEAIIGSSSRSHAAGAPNAAFPPPATVDPASEPEFDDMDDIIREFDVDMSSGTGQNRTTTRSSRETTAVKNHDVITIDSDDDSDQENRPIPSHSYVGDEEVVEDLSAYLGLEEVIELSD
jgi:hypothetical protein